MIRKAFFQIPQLFLQLIHTTPSSITSIDLGAIFTIINLAQQISLIYDSQYSINQEFKFIFAFAQYCFFVDTNLFAQQLESLIVEAFIINTVFIIFFVLCLFRKNKTKNLTNNQMLHYFTLHYPQMFFIPIFYSSIKYLSTTLTINYVYVIFAFINMSISMIIKSLHVYFCRASSLMNNSNVLLLNHSIILNIIREVLIFITILLKVQKISTVIRLIILVSKSFIFLTYLFRQQNCSTFTHIYVFGIITNISIYLKLSIFGFLVYCCLCYAVIQHMLQIIAQSYLFAINQENIVTLQILENFKKNANQTSNLIFLTVYKTHKKNNCKCQSVSNMLNCIFSQLIKRQQNQDEILLYCDYIKEFYPLKSAILIFKTQNTNYYFQCASSLLLKQSRSQSFQIFQGSQHPIEQDNSSRLNTQSVIQTLNVPDQIFPLFNLVIKQKINFWLHFIKGYPNIENCLKDAFNLSQSMINCKQKIEKHYDLENKKLINSDHKDVISMKILQIYYCIIYDNKYISFHLQQELIEQLKIDQVLQDKYLNSYKLATNKVFVFQSSLVKNKGELLNLNKTKLSYYFDVSENSISNLKYYAQLMPEFISRGHDIYIKNFLKKGYTIHEAQPLSTFFKNPEQYIESCQLNFYHYYSKDDFIMNLLLSRSQQKEALVFGVDGVILGVTKQFFEEVVNYNFTLGSQTQASKDSKQIGETQITQFLSKKPLIQFYIPNIAEQIKSLQKQNKMTQQNYLHNIKSTWMFPLNYSECLHYVETLLDQFKQVQRKPFKSKSNIQKFQGEDKQTIQQKVKNLDTFIYSPKCFSEFNGELEINGTQILLLHPIMQEKLFKFIDFETSHFQLTLQYSIEFNQLQYECGQFGYFVMTIQDYKEFNSVTFLSNPSARFLKMKISGNEDYVNQELSLQQINQLESSNQKQEQDFSEAKSDVKQLYHNPLNKEFEQLNFSDTNQDQIELKTIQKHLEIDTYRGNNQEQKLIQQSKYSENLEDVDLQSQIMNQAKQERLQQKRQPSQYQRHSVFQNKKVQPDNFKNDFASNPSKSSATSTLKETQVLIEQLYFKKNLILPLQKVSLTLLVSMLSILLCNILNYYLINNNLDQQLEGVQNLVAPQNITYLYSSIFYQLWSLELHNRKILSLTPFQYANNFETMAAIFGNVRPYLPNLNLIVPQQAENQNIVNFPTKYIINDEIVIKNYTEQEFYLMMNQIIEQEYRDALTNHSSRMSQLYTNGFIRQNIIDLFVEINQLVVGVISETVNALHSGQNQFTTDIFIQLFCILICLVLTVRFWMFFDKIQKSIIFLMSMTSENQALKYINILNSFKSCIEDSYSNKWIQIDFNEIELNNEKNLKGIPLEKLVKKHKSDNSLYSRINKTSYYSKINFITISVILVSWILFQLIGYIIFVQNNNSFQPSLLITLKYGQFRIKMDTIGFLGGLAKTENLLDDNDLSFINQTQLILLLIDCKDNLVPLMEEVATTILLKETSNNNLNQFDEFLNGNICELVDWENIKSCDPSKQNYPYNSSDVIYDIMEHGILGYTSALVKYLDQDFDFELKNLVYEGIEQNLQAIKSQNFENFFLSYYCDIQDNFVRFLNKFKLDNQNIADQNMFIMQLYYLVVGSLYIIALLAVSIIWIINSNRRMSKIRQVLVLVHSDLLQNPNMKNRAKLILKWLY